MTGGTVVRSPEETVRAWPGDARVVALVSDEEGGAIPFGALDLMEGLAHRWRPALLASVQPGAGLPDEGGGGADRASGAGLAAVIRGEASLKETARPRPDRSFAFLPAGDDVTPEELLESPALRRLAEGVRSAGGVLVLHVPVGVGASAPGWIDGRLLAGPGDGERPSFGDDLPALGRLAASGSGGAEERSGRWRRHRKERDIPVARLVAAAVGLAVIVGAWWYLAGESVEMPGTTASPPAADTAAPGAEPDRSAGGTPPADTGAPTSGGAEGETEAGVGEEGPAAGEATSEEAAAESPELAYSVLVASYRGAEDAAARVERLRESVTVPVFATPTGAGERMWHRVFAGALPDTAAAAGLMRSLADRGLKRSVSAWDLRPARWALLLGRYGTESAAREARRALGPLGVHAYLLTEVATGDTTYLLYAGAFETSGAAGPLLESFGEAGRDAELLTRRGEPR